MGNTLSYIIDTSQKIRAKLRYNNCKPWLSEGIRISIKKKNKLYLKYHRTKPASNEVAYKCCRKKLNHVLKIAERKHYADIIEKNKSNPRKTWAIMKELINKNKVKVPQSKFKLSDGSFTTDKGAISENFKNFFISVCQTLARKILPNRCNPNATLALIFCKLFICPQFLKMKSKKLCCLKKNLLQEMMIIT